MVVTVVKIIINKIFDYIILVRTRRFSFETTYVRLTTVCQWNLIVNNMWTVKLIIISRLVMQ